MKDDLKRYVDNHRLEFEIHKPDADELWRAIEADLEQTPNRGVGWKQFLKIAAVLLIGFGSLLILYKTQYQVNPADGVANINILAPELGETGQYYEGLINEKMEFIQANSNLIDPIVLEDIALLDQAFSELKEDLADNADNEEVVNAMIKNYRIKLQILERILTEIQSEETIDETTTDI